MLVCFALSHILLLLPLSHSVNFGLPCFHALKTSTGEKKGHKLSFAFRGPYRRQKILHTSHGTDTVSKIDLRISDSAIEYTKRLHHSCSPTDIEAIVSESFSAY